MQRRISGLCLVLLLAAANISSAQIFRLPIPLPNPFTRRRTAAPTQGLLSRPSAAQEQVPSATPAPAEAPKPSSAGDKSGGKLSTKCSGKWGLTAAGASGLDLLLPPSTDRVLICLISSGVSKNSPSIKHNRWTGCTKEDPLDPTGCTLPWAANPSSSAFRPRGTWAASIMAASGGGIIPGSTDIHVVPVDSPGTGSVDPSSAAPSGKSRLRAYSVCEGRLRGLQAMDYSSGTNKAPWRMVMLVDVAADKQASNGPGDYAMTEADWVKLATGTGTAEAPHAPDVLIVAPAGHESAVGYPAALPGVLGVGGFKCNGEPLQSYADGNSSKPDILAPGMNIAIQDTDKPWTDSTAAAALVAGAAARLWSAYPQCNADNIKAALLSSTPGKGQPARLSLHAAASILELSPCGQQSKTL